MATNYVITAPLDTNKYAPGLFRVEGIEEAHIYKTRRCVGYGVVALKGIALVGGLLGLALGVYCLKGLALTNLGGYLKDLALRRSVWIGVEVAGCGVLIVAAGAAGILCRIWRNERIGEDWAPLYRAIYPTNEKNPEKVECETAYIHLGGVRGGTGVARVYLVRYGQAPHLVRTLQQQVLVPVYMVGAQLYQLLAVATAPLRSLLACAVEEGIPQVDPKKWCGLQLQSMWKIVQAPFYALAYLGALIYSDIDRRAGMAWAAAIEGEWNNTAPLDTCYSVQQGWGSKFSSEHPQFVLDSTYHPVAHLHFDKWKLTQVEYPVSEEEPNTTYEFYIPARAVSFWPADFNRFFNHARDLPES